MRPGNSPWTGSLAPTRWPPSPRSVEDLFRAVDDDDRGILELSLQGFTAAEIGLRLGRALRSVQRLRERIRRRLERHALEGLGVGG